MYSSHHTQIYQAPYDECTRTHQRDESFRRTAMQMNHSAGLPCILNRLPCELLYHSLTWCERPTDRGPFIVRSLTPCSAASAAAFRTDRDALWNLLLGEYGDDARGRNAPSPSSSTLSPRRASKRQRKSPREWVVQAHRLLCDRSDAAHLALTEAAHDRSNPLTLGKLRAIFRKHGPLLRINQRATIGGTLLVECCRARYCRESVILACVRELVEKHGADPDVATGAGPGAGGAGGLTPLCVAAARGMASVVRFLVCMDAPLPTPTPFSSSSSSSPSSSSSSSSVCRSLR